MDNSVSVTDMARHFADYVNRVAYRGETFVLYRGNKAVAQLQPVPTGKPLKELPALLASLPKLTDEELSELSEDLNTIREDAVEYEDLRDPWAS